jgi:hypothetical protein
MISPDEWKELDKLRRELNFNLMAYGTEAQEKFTELFVKSIEGKGDERPGAVSRTWKGGLPPFARGESEL